MSRTFSNDVYSVTVNDDHSIRVRPGDWISKYSVAIYGDPKINWKRFKRKDSTGRFIDLVDPNKIVTGETLWHPDPLPGERPGRRPGAPIGVRPPESPVPPGEIDPYRVHQFLQLLKQWLCPVNDWDFETSAGVDLSESIFAGHYCTSRPRRPAIPNRPGSTRWASASAWDPRTSPAPSPSRRRMIRFGIQDLSGNSRRRGGRSAPTGFAAITSSSTRVPVS